MFINKESLINLKKINNSNYSKYNRTLGIEYNYASIDNLWQGKILMLKTFTDNNNNNNNTSFASHLEYNSTNWKWRIQQEFIGEDFNAEVGYVPRKGFLKLSSSLGYLFYKENSKIIYHGPQFSRILYLDKNYKKTDLINALSYVINYKNRSSLKIFLQQNFVKLLDDFDPIKSNIKSLLKGSDHKWNYLSLEYLSNQQKKLTYKFEGIIGGYYQNGKRKGIGTELGYRFQPYVSLSSLITYNSIELESPWNESNFWLIGAKVDITLTNKIFFSNLYQYNKQFDLWNFNSRFQWRYKPASDLFIVFNSTEILMPKEVKSWNINFKLNYWLNFN
jgi:hypothetical protein